MADDLERLVASFDADITRFEKQMTKMGVVFQKQADSIVKGQKELTTKLNSGWTKLNFGGFQKALLGGLSIAALGAFIDKTSDLTESILKMSHATGLSTDTFQEWSIVAKQNEVDQGSLTTALEKFTKNLGDAQLGTGQFAKILDALHVSAKGTVEEVFLRFIDAVKDIRDPTQRAAVLAQAFGRGWADAAGFINLGSKAIEEASAQAKGLGQVISGDTLKKIDDLGDAWASFKAQLQTAGADALGGFADEFKKFAGDVNSAEFKSSMKQFGESLALIAGLLVKIAPALPAITLAFAGGRIAGAPGALLGGGLGLISQLPAGSIQSKIGVQQRNLKNFQDQLKSQQSLPTWAQWLNGPYSADELMKKIDETKKKIASLQAQIGPQPVTVTSAQKPQSLGGNIDLSGVLGPKPTPDYLLPVKVTPKAVNPLTPDEEQQFKAQQEAIKAGQDQIDQYEEQIALLGKIDGAAASAAFKQEALNHLAEEFGKDTDAYKAAAQDVDFFAKKIGDAADEAAAAQEQFARVVALSDQFRNGLADVAASSVQGFAAMRQALGNFLLQLAEAILRMQEMKIIEDQLGKSGTSGTGIFGSIISAIAGGSSGGSTDLVNVTPNVFGGYASGTQSASPGWHWVGEKGPELMKLPGGAQIVPSAASMAMARVPNAQRAASPSVNVTIPVDARGAQVGVADEVTRQLRSVAPAIVQAAVSQSRKEFPGNMTANLRDRM